MFESDVKEFIEDKKEYFIALGYAENEAESLAYSRLEEYLKNNNLKLEY